MTDPTPPRGRAKDGLAANRIGPDRAHPGEARSRSVAKGDVPRSLMDRYLIERDLRGRPERFYAITTPGQCLVRRSAIESNGAAFDQSLSPCEDWDFWYQICADGGTVRHLRDVVLRYRTHASNASKQYALMRTQRQRFYDKHRDELSALDPERFRTAYAFGMYGYDAKLCGRWARDSIRARRFVDAARYLRRAAIFQVKYLRASRA